MQKVGVVYEDFSQNHIHNSQTSQVAIKNKEIVSKTFLTLPESHKYSRT